MNHSVTSGAGIAPGQETSRDTSARRRRGSHKGGLRQKLAQIESAIQSAKVCGRPFDALAAERHRVLSMLGEQRIPVKDGGPRVVGAEAVAIHCAMHEDQERGAAFDLDVRARRAAPWPAAVNKLADADLHDLDRRGNTR